LQLTGCKDFFDNLFHPYPFTPNAPPIASGDLPLLTQRGDGKLRHPWLRAFPYTLQDEGTHLGAIHFDTFSMSIAVARFPFGFQYGLSLLCGLTLTLLMLAVRGCASFPEALSKGPRETCGTSMSLQPFRHFFDVDRSPAHCSISFQYGLFLLFGLTLTLLMLAIRGCTSLPEALSKGPRETCGTSMSLQPFRRDVFDGTTSS